VLNGGSGTITLGGDWNNAGTFIAGTGTVVMSDVCGVAGAQLTGNTTFNNLTLSSATGKTFAIPAGHHVTVTGTLTLQGVPGTPVNIVSSAPGTYAYVALPPGANVVRTVASVSPWVILGAGPGAGAIQVPALNPIALLALMLFIFIIAARFGRLVPLRGDSNHVEEK
jgi:hypothetical protein